MGREDSPVTVRGHESRTLVRLPRLFGAVCHRFRVAVPAVLVLPAASAPQQVAFVLSRLNQLPDEDMEKMDNARYLGNDFRLRWIMIGLILLTITGMWLHFTMTREAIFYGGIIWAVCYYFRNALTEQFNNIKARIIKRYKTD